MNQQLKTVLLTVLTLSLFVIALVELSGVSRTALLNKFDPKAGVAATTVPKTTIQFYETKYSFGTISEGTKAKHAFRFKNSGSNPLLITDAKASCGCTIPSYPKEPIPPGGEGEIVVEFNSSGRPGHNEKNVLVYSNAQQESMSIGFDVEVKKEK